MAANTITRPPAATSSSHQQHPWGWEPSRPPANWYHVDGNLAAKTRSNHPNGVVGSRAGVSVCVCVFELRRGSRVHAGSSRGSQDTRNGTPRLVLRDGGKPTHRHTGPRTDTMWQGSKLDGAEAGGPRTLLEPVCDRFTVRRTSPRCAPPSHVQACHSSLFCNFVLRLLVGDHSCVLVTRSCVCFFPRVHRNVRVAFSVSLTRREAPLLSCQGGSRPQSTLSP